MGVPRNNIGEHLGHYFRKTICKQRWAGSAPSRQSKTWLYGRLDVASSAKGGVNRLDGKIELRWRTPGLVLFLTFGRGDVAGSN